MKHEDITEQVIGAFYEVYNELGPGFLESVYHNAMLIALQERNLECESERPLQVSFRGQVVGDFRADLIVAERVIVELKSCKAISDAYLAQTLNYLRATEIEVGLILNFGPQAKIKRVVLGEAFSD